MKDPLRFSPTESVLIDTVWEANIRTLRLERDFTILTTVLMAAGLIALVVWARKGIE